MDEGSASENGNKIQLVVKPSSGGGGPYQVEIAATESVLELKNKVAEASGIPASEQRLISKGQILKDERVCESYGKSGWGTVAACSKSPSREVEAGWPLPICRCSNTRW